MVHPAALTVMPRTNASAADVEYWERLAHAWTHAEGPGRLPVWRTLFSSARSGREHLMPTDVRELVDAFPARVRVGRGAVRGVNEAGLAWTASREDAVAWARRNVGLHDAGDPVVVRASVARQDVIAVFVERLETEFLVLPENVVVEAIEDVQDDEVRPKRRGHGGTRSVEIEAAD